MKRPGKAVTIFSAMVVLLAAVPTLSAPPQVSVATPLPTAVTDYVFASGTTSATNQVDLVARVVGTLQKVGYQDGDHVTKGQTLFEIDPDAYQASVASAQAAVEKAQAELANANADLERKTQLSQQQVASQADLNSSRASRDSSQADVDQSKAQLRSAQITLGYTTVVAPFDGVVSARQADPGALVGGNAATVLATIYQTDPIRVSFSLDERLVETIRDAMRAKGLKLSQLGPVPVEAGLQTETSYPHAGTLSYIAPSVDSGTGTLQLRADLPNSDAVLLAGQFVRIRVPVRRDVKVLILPDTALLSDAQGQFVLTVDGKNIATTTHVVTGAETGTGGIEIRSGLAEDARVIVVGADGVTAGQTVTPQETKLDPGLVPK